MNQAAERAVIYLGRSVAEWRAIIRAIRLAEDENDPTRRIFPTLARDLEAQLPPPDRSMS
jgi:hypothetical protein